LPAARLTADHVQRAAEAWRAAGFAQHTRSTYSKCLRRFLRWLERIGIAPLTISDAVPKIHQPQPRTTIATDEERRQILEAASPGFRFFLLLCADLGLRHRTAARICAANYNPHLRALSFYTKGNVHQTLPVSAAIAEIIEKLPKDINRQEPIVNILRGHRPGTQPGPAPRFTKQWKALKKRAGIRAELRIHDLRRTLAEDVWNATHDLRAVQAQLGHRSPTTTARYLADRITLQDLKPILRKVQQLRTLRETETAAAAATIAAPEPLTHDPDACPTCPAQPFCNENSRICLRDNTQHDA
jgi:integrase